MAKFKAGDKVRIKTPAKFPAVSKFVLTGAKGTVGVWVDWPEAMDPYNEYVYMSIDQASGEGKAYEGVNMIFHEDSLEKAK